VVKTWCLGCISCQKPLRMRWKMDECKPLPALRRCRQRGAHSPHGAPPPPPRGLHSSTFRLNVSTFCGIRGALSSSSGGVCDISGANRGC
jgi:hypothetical protein